MHYVLRGTGGVPEKDLPRFIAEAVDISPVLKVCGASPQPVRECVEFAVSNRLHEMTSDEEGCFVIIPDRTFSVKTFDAARKNFWPIGVKPSKVRERAISLLKTHSLDIFAGSAKQGKGLTLDLFFTAKTHEPDVPFRAIVSERSSRQRIVSGYLQKHLD